MRFDVVVIGGGVAGSSIAAFLSRSGVEVLLLEKTPEFRDENRGELLWPWGVREARLLNVESVLIEAGAQSVSEVWGWDSLSPGVQSILDLGEFFSDVDGSLNLGHPQARQALLDHARRFGSTVRRPVASVQVGKGHVSWTEEGERHEVTCRFVIGADGRRSTVRRQAGIEIHRGPIEHYCAGALVASEGIPEHANVSAHEGSTNLLSFPQLNRRSRVYLVVPTESKTRFTGEGGERRFFEESNLECLPGASAWSNAEIAGPLGTFPCGDTWVDNPLVDGIALIGDAGGYNNLLIGQGLSMALRDARLLGELLLGDDWSPHGLAAFASERTERLHRQRFVAHLVAASHRYFRHEDSQRTRIRDLIKGDDLLSSFGSETFLGGLTRTTEEVREAERRLDAIEAEIAVA